MGSIFQTYSTLIFTVEHFLEPILCALFDYGVVWDIRQRTQVEISAKDSTIDKGHHWIFSLYWQSKITQRQVKISLKSSKISDDPYLEPFFCAQFDSGTIWNIKKRPQVYARR